MPIWRKMLQKENKIQTMSNVPKSIKKKQNTPQFTKSCRKKQTHRSAVNVQITTT